MKFEPTAIEGAYVIELAVQHDSRGSFARTFCRDTFRVAGIDFEVVQANLSRNDACHTLRGLHTQRAPHAEPKLVQCVRGAIFDVAVDLRTHSPSRGAVVAVELAATGDRMFFIPPGCAHGFLTLEPDCDLIYYMGAEFVPGTGIGVRWNDPAFDIAWPAPPSAISERDANYPDFGKWPDAQ
ncbi:MAG: dTDP-4-dehydrorhamnose 3,5-epimerase family protein [Janthinobacterium lividum]